MNKEEIKKPNNLNSTKELITKNASFKKSLNTTENKIKEEKKRLVKNLSKIVLNRETSKFTNDSKSDVKFYLVYLDIFHK